MSLQEQAAQVRALYQAFQTRSFERMAGAFTEDAELVNMATGDAYRGKEGYLQFARGWAAAFPDLRVEVIRYHSEESWAVVEYAFRGTHSGAMISNAGFIPPTWAQVDFRLCDSVQLRGGRISRLCTYFDSATMLRQMGLLPNSPLHATDRRAALELYAMEVDASAQERNKAIVQRFLEEVLNQHNPAATVSICTPDVRWHGGAMGEAVDLGSFQNSLAAVFASFPDLNVEVHDATAEQDRVAVRVTLRGTHLGEFQGLTTTGKRISSTGLAAYRLSQNRIVEAWWQHDFLAMMKQLGPAPALRSTTT